MPNVIKEVQLIFSEISGNNNKVWRGFLHDDDSVRVEWGRIGATVQTKTFPGVGEKYLEAKKKSKLKKGYTILNVVSNTAETTVKDVSKNDLHEIAKKQIIASDPIVEKLIERLVKANIHKITSSTTITFNKNAGTFSTPLGIVTLEAIDEARTFLADIEKFVKKADYTNPDFASVTSKYLRLIPQHIVGRLKLEKIFPNIDSVKKQNDILDALESSYKAVSTAPPTSSKKKNEKQEQVFNLKLTLVSNEKTEEIRKLYKKTLHGSHASSKLDVVKVYKVTIDSMIEAFAARSKTIGNVMQLWHGTKAANLLSILKSGLKISPPSTVSIAGKMFGNGIYFSDQSTKSLNYAYGYWDGKYENECFMFLANVAMGNTYIPKTSQSSGWKPPKEYDSCFAKGGISGVQNNEMIVYKEDQYNLVYLVEFGTKK